MGRITNPKAGERGFIHINSKAIPVEWDGANWQINANMFAGSTQEVWDTEAEAVNRKPTPHRDRSKASTHTSRTKPKD